MEAHLWKFDRATTTLTRLRQNPDVDALASVLREMLRASGLADNPRLQHVLRTLQSNQTAAAAEIELHAITRV